MEKRASGATPSIATKSATASANAASTTPQPISEMAIRGSARPKSPSATKPASGRSRIYGVRFNILALQRIQVVHVNLVARAEDRDDDRQPHYHLGGGDRQHQEDEHPAVYRVQEVREGHEREVDGVEHQLDGHEHHQRVTAHQHAHRADGEDQRADDEICGNWHGTLPPTTRARSGGS